MSSNQTAPTSHDEWSEHIAMWRAGKRMRIAYCQQYDLKLNALIYHSIP